MVQGRIVVWVKRSAWLRFRNDCGHKRNQCWLPGCGYISSLPAELQTDMLLQAATAVAFLALAPTTAAVFFLRSRCHVGSWQDCHRQTIPTITSRTWQEVACKVGQSWSRRSICKQRWIQWRVWVIFLTFRPSNVLSKLKLSCRSSFMFA